jgi:FKBP-type peptidyl-prolyl cis-trans isomerase
MPGVFMRFAVLAAVAALTCFTAPAANAAAAKPDCTFHPAADTSAASNDAFLKAFAAQQGVVKRPSGLLYCVETAGHGRSPKPTDQVVVTYKGQLIDGNVFDQTQPGATATFPANRLIKGWVEALALMHEGDTWELVIPSYLAYGENGTPGGPIGPNQTLVFTMTLQQVK